MSRFLFVVPPLVGHLNPAVAVAAELAARGHSIGWAGVPELIAQLAGPAAEVHPCAVSAGGPDGPAQRPPELRGPAALKFLWEDFLIPLAEAMAPGVTAAVARFRPDVLVVDQQAVAGALVAERLGLPWATSATTSAEFTGALDGMPLVDAWIAGLLADLRTRIGDPRGSADPRFSPHLILAFTTPELAGSVAAPPGPLRFVGPAMTPRPGGPAFPWSRLDPDRATVLVTLGTVNTDAGSAFLSACEQSLRARSARLQAVVVDPGGVLGDRDPADPDIVVQPRVPQLDLLARAAAVICHAGHNTVCEALWHGVPLVVAPIRDDQPVVAGQVVAAGAGVRVRFGRTSADRLGQALDTVLDDPAHQGAARRVGASFRAAGGAARAADHLEELTARSPR
ncbi:UDP:flavonoid glycosyltransferase YjiC (YdhE family) [Kitasatospora sp. MAP12-15]|uniref:glycosyltransferase n=1 Tax=unclassified Kitasatospora TaxID=2633591 RepID=UPI00247634DF|nr:nucleotide disphospho-sugar-binding domain-containing protein [Kitasatospora sp. MAP12-44]MDH6115077.1 UDP:flavonoid glycosyltransferase YjiC (YdhE family) [Kitasatospora sp. MAP12-44]